MNKSDMIRKLAKKHKLPVAVVKKVVDDLFVIIMGGVLNGETVTVSGFGRFYVKEFAPTKGVSFSGREEYYPSRLSPAFVPSTGFKKSVNQLKMSKFKKSARKGGDVHEDES